MLEAIDFVVEILSTSGKLCQMMALKHNVIVYVGWLILVGMSV